MTKTEREMVRLAESALRAACATVCVKWRDLPLEQREDAIFRYMMHEGETIRRYARRNVFRRAAINRHANY